MTKKDLVVLVTAIGGSGHGEQTLKALKDSTKIRLEIVGADVKATVFQAQWVDHFVQLPPASHPDYIKQLLRTCEIFRVKAIFHGSEPEMLAISKARSLFLEAGVVPVMNSEEVISLCSSKLDTAEFLRAKGFSPPRFAQVSKRNDLNSIDYFPVVVKPSRASGGSANVFVAQTKDELADLTAYLFHSFGGEMMIQEYVGDALSEYTVGVLSSPLGDVVSSIAVRRNLSGLLNLRTRTTNITGKRELGEFLVVSSGVSEGLVGRFPEVCEPCESIARELGSRGPLNIQCRLDSSGVRVFEINPRLSGTSSLRSAVGYDEVGYLLEAFVLGEESLMVPHPPPRPIRVQRGLKEYVWDNNR